MNTLTERPRGATRFPELTPEQKQAFWEAVRRAAQKQAAPPADPEAEVEAATRGCHGRRGQTVVAELVYPQLTPAQEAAFWEAVRQAARNAREDIIQQEVDRATKGGSGRRG